jgi:hypothetical protein
MLTRKVRLHPGISRTIGPERDCHDPTRGRLYARSMPLRMHRVSAARWHRLAASRQPSEAGPSELDLIALEIESADPRRRARAEVELIQAYVDAMEPARATR